MWRVSTLFAVVYRHVRTLIDDSTGISVVYPYPEFIQLMDDDIASLTGLMLLVNPSRREGTILNNAYTVTQLSLSLYLMTQCQIKLHHSVTSLAQSLLYIDIARRSSRLQGALLDQLLLTLTEQKILRFISV